MKNKWELSLFFLVLLAACFVVTGCRSSESGVREKGYFVKNVTDGDTIELSGGRKVRYIGIDTPETMERKGTRWVFNPEEFAVEAKDYNRSLVLHKNVRLEFDKNEKDKYDRLLAYVYLGDMMVNSELIRKGYTLLYTFPPNVKHLELFLEAQETARRQRSGLWGTLKTISPDAAGNHIGKYRIVTGKVENIFFSSRKISLNFGYDKREYLTCVIFGGNFSLFTEKGIDPSSDYKGKYVEVVGKIKDKSGPQMIIDNPSQIKILDK